MNSYLALTNGENHVGLTVSKLEESAAFFIDVLGWTEVRREGLSSNICYRWCFDD